MYSACIKTANWQILEHYMRMFGVNFVVFCGPFTLSERKVFPWCLSFFLWFLNTFARCEWALFRESVISLHIRSMWETICDAWACWSGWKFGSNSTEYPYSELGTEYPPPHTKKKTHTNTYTHIVCHLVCNTALWVKSYYIVGNFFSAHSLHSCTGGRTDFCCTRYFASYLFSRAL